jgi:hypothetical protein
MAGEFHQDRIESGAEVTAIDDPFRAAMMKGLMGLVIIEPVTIIVVLAVLGVPWWVFLLVLSLATFVPALVIWLIVQLAWNPNARRWPAQPVLPGAVSKSWQSFAFGRLNRFNNCITILADERCLHLEPFALFRLQGARRISLPLDRMTELRRSLAPGMMSARIDGRLIYGPSWCMRLVQPEPGESVTMARGS